MKGKKPVRYKQNAHEEICLDDDDDNDDEDGDDNYDNNGSVLGWA